MPNTSKTGNNGRRKIRSSRNQSSGKSDRNGSMSDRGNMKNENSSNSGKKSFRS